MYAHISKIVNLMVVLIVASGFIHDVRCKREEEDTKYEGHEDYEAYDCTTLNNPVYYSTNTSENCDASQVKLLSTREEYGMLLQVDDSSIIQAQACTRKVLKRKIFCNSEYDTQILVTEENFRDFKSDPISITDCAAIWEHRKWEMKDQVLNMIPGKTRYHIPKDQVWGKGYCRGLFYYNTLIITSLLISDVHIHVKFDSLGEPKDYFHQSKGEIFKIAQGWGHTKLGTIISWNPADIPSEPYSSAFKGTAQILTYSNNAEVLYIPERTAALELKGKTGLAGESVYTTDISNFYWVPKSIFPKSFDKPPSGGQLSSFLMITSKYLSAKIDIKHQSTEIYSYRGHCALEVRLKKLAYSRRDLSPDELGFILLKVKGYAVMIAGELLSVYKCEKRSFKLDETRGCYKDIPIRLDDIGEDAFLMPRTRSITMRSSKMDCDDPGMPVVRMGIDYYKLNPKSRKVSVSGSLPSIINLPELDYELEKSYIYDHNIIKEIADRKVYYEKQREAEIQSLYYIDPSIGEWAPDKRSFYEQILVSMNTSLSIGGLVIWLSIITTYLIFKKDGPGRSLVNWIIYRWNLYSGAWRKPVLAIKQEESPSGERLIQPTVSPPLGVDHPDQVFFPSGIYPQVTPSPRHST